MKKYLSPFNSDQLNDPDTVVALVAVAKETSHKHTKLAFAPSGAYGVSVLSGEDTYVQWGAGYGWSQIVFIACGVQRLLEQNTSGKKLVIYTEAGLWNHISPTTGYVRKAMLKGGLNGKGKPYEGFAQLAEITKRLDAGDWYFESYRPKDKAEGAKRANQAAQEGALYAENHLSDLPNSDSNVLEKFRLLATDENPDLLALGVSQ